ncbi:MAG: hypothetical protein HY290_04675 [Planctomycetia bacterium]|nr:hypothetical protein [Planctomycetia bacterium]
MSKSTSRPNPAPAATSQTAAAHQTQVRPNPDLLREKSDKPQEGIVAQAAVRRIGVTLVAGT